MGTRKAMTRCGAIALAVSLPFVLLHLVASPDDAPISPVQHVVAALANYVGPWGVTVVQLVDFPNAGLRSFSWALSAGMTLLGAAQVLLLRRIESRPGQVWLLVAWGIFMAAWFTVGFTQIADGLL